MKVKVKELEIALEWWLVLLIVIIVILIIKVSPNEALVLLKSLLDKLPINS